MIDPIVDEVRRVRDAHAARFNYDLDAIFRDIKEQEERSGSRFVSFAPDTAEPIEVVQPTGAAGPDSCDVPGGGKGDVADHRNRLGNPGNGN